MTVEFLKALLIRTAKTWCQAFVAVVGVDGGYRAFNDINWKLALEAATVAAIICFFWNLGIGLPEVELAKTQELTNEEAKKWLEEDEEALADLEDGYEDAGDGREEGEK